MREEYAHVTPGRKENLQATAVALGIAAGVGAAVFYFTRILLSRENLGVVPTTPEESPEAR